MPRVTLTRTTPLGPYPTLQPAADALDLVMTAGDASQLNQFLLDGPGILVVQNTGVGARTFTITSVADGLNRTGDVTAFSMAAADISVFKIDNVAGWRQTDGYLYITPSHAEIKFGFIRLG